VETHFSEINDHVIYSQPIKIRPKVKGIQTWQTAGIELNAISLIGGFVLEKKYSSRLWKEHETFLEGRVSILPVDQIVASCSASVAGKLPREDRLWADFDLHIAATALALRLILVSRNRRDFESIPVLRVGDCSP